MGAAASTESPLRSGRVVSAPLAAQQHQHQQHQLIYQQATQHQHQHQPPLGLHQVPGAASAPVVTTSWPPLDVARPTPLQQLPAPTGRNPATAHVRHTAADEGVRLCCKFRLQDLSEATDNFSSSNVIGEGGFGKVYRGVLMDGTEVAVKRLDPLSLQGDREFYAEVALLTRLRHPNLVCLMGMCDEGSAKLGVFEFMRRGSLRDLLDKKLLSSWKDRLSIAIGSARGLTYLHEMSEPPVIHCDFKSSNVLIDTYGQAHVADFGLSRHIGSARRSVVTSGAQYAQASMSDVTTVSSIRGTYGYLSPEYLEQGHASVKADVFAYGVVLLELMTAQEAVDAARGRGHEGLADWARPMLQRPEFMQAMLDPCVANQAPTLQMAVLCEVAEACLRPNPRERPSMLEIVRTLSAASTFSEPAAAASIAGSRAAQAPTASAIRQPAINSADLCTGGAGPSQAADGERQPPSRAAVPPASWPLPPLDLKPVAGGWGPGSPIGALAASKAPTPGETLASNGWNSSTGRRLLPIESIRQVDGDVEASLPRPAIRVGRSGQEGQVDEVAGVTALLHELAARPGGGPHAAQSHVLPQTARAGHVLGGVGQSSANVGVLHERAVLPSVGQAPHPRPSPAGSVLPQGRAGRDAPGHKAVR